MLVLEQETNINKVKNKAALKRIDFFMIDS
jgi:hypothetical protein